MPTEMTFRDCLDQHARCYPLMQIQDLVKLAYQAAFAGGHMIADTSAAQQYLQAEYKTVMQDMSAQKPALLFEPIGNGLCRLHLRELSRSGISLETAGRLFILTANEHQGTTRTLQQNLNMISQAAAGLPLEAPLLPEAWAAYLLDYQRQGTPPVHHSERFRQAYRPAYRVVRAEFARYEPLFAAIDQALCQKPYLTVALDGNSGAGKSTLAILLNQLYGGNLFHMDDFFLQPRMRTVERLVQPGGNVDRERFQAEIMQNLAGGKGFSYRVYDCKTQTLGFPVAVQPARFNLIEGVYSLHPEMARKYDLKVFLRTSPHKQRQRILERNGPVLYKRFLEEWIPLENQYFNAFHIEEQCDLVIES